MVQSVQWGPIDKNIFKYAYAFCISACPLFEVFKCMLRLITLLRQLNVSDNCSVPIYIPEGAGRRHYVSVRVAGLGGEYEH